MTSEDETETASARPLFWARLLLGLAQGWFLYFLYHAADTHAWPATDPTWFAPLSMAGLFVPLLISQAMGTMRLRALVIWAVIATVACCGLAFYDRLEHAGDSVLARDNIYPRLAVLFFGFAGLFIAQSLIAAGDAERRFIASYGSYFDAAWKLGVQLALAQLFVGVFWGVLWLGAGLFNLIKLDFFSTLIRHEWFAIPATALASAAAIHLTDVRARMVAGIRSVVLTLLGWLLPLMTLLAAGFLAGLFFTGFAPLWQTRAATAGLLGAAAMLVVLINAAYQSGETERPLVLRIAEAVASLALVPLVLIAAYALSLRVGQYGWTVERISGLACVVAALCYAVGYTVAAILSLFGRPWMNVLRSVNVATSFVVIALLLALFTPIADPMKISVDDQVARLRAGKIAPATFDYNYLRLQTGRFGMDALHVLSADRNAQIAGKAREALRNRFGINRVYPEHPLAAKDLTANITVYPKGKTLPPALLAEKWTNVEEQYRIPGCLRMVGMRCDAILVDLNGDGTNEVVFVITNSFLSRHDGYWLGTVLQRESSGRWGVAGTMPGVHCKGELDALRAGKFKLVPPTPAPSWERVEINGHVLRFIPSFSDFDYKCPK